MVSGDSLRGMRKISLEWLSKARSGAGWVLREYRLVVAFVSGGIFGGKTEGIEKGRRERNSGWLEDPSLADALSSPPRSRQADRPQSSREGVHSAAKGWGRG